MYKRQGIRIKATALEQTGDSGFASVEKTGDLPIPAGVWESTDSGVLSADPSSGAIKAQGAGTAALCYTFSLGTVKCSVKQDFSITHSHIPLTGITLNKSSLSPVSYTHLDVYKRQPGLFVILSEIDQVVCFL